MVIVSKDMFPSDYMMEEVVEGKTRILLRVPSRKSFPEVIDWNVKPPLGYYMFELQDDGTNMELLWGETSILDPAVEERRTRHASNRMLPTV